MTGVQTCALPIYKVDRLCYQFALLISYSQWDRFLKQKKQYDIIFADPPYGKIDIDKLTKKCFSSLLKDGRFILESSKRDDIPPGGISKKYGDTIVTIWTKSV